MVKGDDMKVLYLHQYFATPGMSGSTRSYEMARRLVKWGHEVHVVTTCRNPHSRSGWYREDIEGIHVHWLPVPYNNAMGVSQRMRAFLTFALRAGQRAASIEADVVLATSTPLTIALPGAWAAWRLKAPMVFEVRDLWPEVPIALGYLRSPFAKAAAKALEKFAYRRSVRVIALSAGMAEGVARTGYAEDRICVIPNGSDLELFQHSDECARRFRAKHPELGQGPIVLYPGTIGRVNGVAYLVRVALHALERRPDVRFVVIGDGAEADMVRDTARNLGVLGVNFFQYPEMPKRDLVDAFSAASVVISLCIDNPALRANSANKFFDGLASGKAVAINYEGWQAALLSDTGAGLSISQDPRNGAQALLELLADPDRLRECGRRARMVAEERFARDKLARKLEHVLYQAVANR